MLVKTVRAIALLILLYLGSPYNSFACTEATGSPISPAQVARLKKRVDALHTALLAKKWRKALKLFSPHVRACYSVEQLERDSMPEYEPDCPNMVVGEIEREGTNTTMNFECGQGSVKIEASFQVDILCQPGTTDDDHILYEGWVLIDNEFYFFGADDG